MPSDKNMILNADAALAAQKEHTAAVDEFLDPKKPRGNLVGMGYGVKWTDGTPTGEPAMLALVSQKIDPDDLPESDLIPKEINGMQTDVLAVGELIADQAEPIEAGIEALARHARPASGGYSVGHINITAGTIGTCVYDQLGTPGNPSGIPSRYYILSNNHVLANSNNARRGDPILQPGPADGGVDPSDRIATLDRSIRITFDPPTPRSLHRNLVDAALAVGQFHDLKREIHWVGHLKGWLKRSQIDVGMDLQKTGRTTNYTTGTITVVGAVVDVGYGGGLIARFRDQIITTPMSAGGDSGSIVADRDNKAVGLLFAGSRRATILNQIEHVRALLDIEIM